MRMAGTFTARIEVFRAACPSDSSVTTALSSATLPIRSFWSASNLVTALLLPSPPQIKGPQAGVVTAMMTARTLAKSGSVLLPPADVPPLDGGGDACVDAVGPLFAAVLVPGVDDVVPVEGVELLEPLMSRRFGGGGGAALAPRLEELGESSRVDGDTAAAARFAGAGWGAATLVARTVLGAADAVGAAFGLRATAFAAGLATLDFRGAGFLGPEGFAAPTFVAPVPSSLSASLTATPRQHCFRYVVEYTKLNRMYCTAWNAGAKSSPRMLAKSISGES
jgi:hypothetical protein